MIRVLADGFDAMFTAGLRDIFGSGAIEFCRPDVVGAAARLDQCLPDVVLLNSAADTTAADVAAIVHRHPSVTVITCSANDHFMRVHPPFHRGESYRALLEPAEIWRYLEG